MNLGVMLREDNVVVSSLQVAEVFEKEHRSVTRDIREIINEIAEVGVCTTLCTPLGTLFYEDSYQNSQNKQRYPMYYMNKDGFVLLVMGYRGQKALKLKLAYINEFNRLKEAIESVEVKEQINIDQSKQFYKELNMRPILDNPFDGSQHPMNDRFVWGIVNILNHYEVQFIGSRDLQQMRQVVKQEGVVHFEEVIEYCVSKGKISGAYINAVLSNYNRKRSPKAKSYLTIGF